MTAISFLINLEYEMEEIVNTKFKTLIYVPLVSTSGIAQASLNSVLELKQKSPIARGTTQRQLYNQSLTELYETYSMTDLIQVVSDRNHTTALRGNPLIVPYGKDTETSVTLNIKIPTQQEVFYFPNYLDSFKNAWIQYVAFFIPLYFFLFKWLFGFTIRTRLFEV